MKLRVWHRTPCLGARSGAWRWELGCLSPAFSSMRFPYARSVEVYDQPPDHPVDGACNGAFRAVYAVPSQPDESRESNFVLQKTGSGEMRISVQAIESIVNKSIRAGGDQAP